MMELLKHAPDVSPNLVFNSFNQDTLIKHSYGFISPKNEVAQFLTILNTHSPVHGDGFHYL
jgi:hypothetical protein